MKIVIIGSKGQLGSEITEICKKKHLNYITFDTPEFDITDQKLVNEKISKEMPDIVVNSSAYTAVDNAENDIEKAYKVNSDGALYLADVCKKLKIPLIHISTDYVFDGKEKEPYKENSIISPLGVYGKSKAEGESNIRKNLNEHVIIRTAWLCGIYGNNFVKTMIRLGKERELIKVVSDQYGSPTFARDLASSVISIANKIVLDENKSWGTYHYCGKGIASWYEFACEIFDTAKKYENLAVKEVKPISTEEYPTPAERPKFSALDCTQIINNFNVQQKDWKTGLREMIDEIYKI